MGEGHSCFACACAPAWSPPSAACSPLPVIDETGVFGSCMGEVLLPLLLAQLPGRDGDALYEIVTCFQLEHCELV